MSFNFCSSQSMHDLLALVGSSSSSSSSSSSLHEGSTTSHSSCEEESSQLSNDSSTAVSPVSKVSVQLPEQVSYLSPHQRTSRAVSLLSQLRLADEDEDLGYESGSEGGPTHRLRMRLQSETRPRRAIQPRHPRGFTAPIPSFRAPSNSVLAATICRPKRPLPFEPTTASHTSSPPTGSCTDHPLRTPRPSGILCPSARRVSISESSPLRRFPSPSFTRPSSCLGQNLCSPSSITEPACSVDTRLSEGLQARTGYRNSVRQYPPISPSLRSWIKNTDFSPRLACQAFEQVLCMDAITPRQPLGIWKPAPATEDCTPDPLPIDLTATQDWKQRVTKAPVGLGIGLPSNHPLRSSRVSTISQLEVSVGSESPRRFSFSSHFPPTPECRDMADKLRLRPTILSDSPSPIVPLPPRVAAPDPEILYGSPPVLHPEPSRAVVGLGLSLSPGQSPRAANLSRMVSVYFSQKLSMPSTPSQTCSPRTKETQKPRLRPTLRSESPSPIIPLPRRISHIAHLPAQHRLSKALVGRGIGLPSDI